MCRPDGGLHHQKLTQLPGLTELLHQSGVVLGLPVPEPAPERSPPFSPAGHFSWPVKPAPPGKQSREEGLSLLEAVIPCEGGRALLPGAVSACPSFPKEHLSLEKK